MTTQSTDGARAHARAQAAAAILERPSVPEGVTPTVADRIPAGGYANLVLGRGTRLRIADPTGTGCAHLLLVRTGAPWERLNVADTVKVPWQAYLGVGHPLLSDQGRVLATVVADTSGHHDALCGPSAAGRARLRLAAAKQGLAPRDVGPTVALFRGVRVEADGALTSTGNGPAGGYVELYLHLPLTVLIANAPGALGGEETGPVDVVAWHAMDFVAANDDPEYQRALVNTEAAWTAAQNTEVSA
ncbi:DUF1989 domain-containing protein [Nocardia camponoti]|uniref:DUF1989 domain-containing protein n=1 Tax=Nocardia camponoti TaxID=1616106 RepID=A0A917QGN0_9NOCA|nr:DUF1989 domain-containing protein [Nocardia camponoti]GGK49640.1 hypothetical protein GCM10011591_21360 [Nocardia camponoti]